MHVRLLAGAGFALLLAVLAIASIRQGLGAVGEALDVDRRANAHQAEVDAATAFAQGGAPPLRPADAPRDATPEPPVDAVQVPQAQPPGCRPTATAASVTPTAQVPVRFAQLRRGWNEDRVRTLLGEPDQLLLDGRGGERWWYYGGSRVRFRAGRVVGWDERDPAAPAY
jgi:hypothetical protein